MSSSRKLPVVVDVPDPCEVGWEDMVGDERARFCGRCGKTVTNLSVLDGDEIADVLARGDCVSFLHRADTSIVMAERQALEGTAGAKAAAVVLAATMALALGCDVRRTGGEPLPPTRAAAGGASQAGVGAGSAGTQGGATVSSAEPASSGIAPGTSAEPAASCNADSKAVKNVEHVLPSERPRRTAGIPRRLAD